MAPMWHDTGLGIAAVVVLPLLVVIAVAASRVAALRHERGVVEAAVRAAVQLAVVGTLIGFALRAVAIGLPAALVIALVVAPGVVPRNPATLLPMGGIVVGNAMNATTLAGRRLLAEYANRYGEFEAGLSIGLSPAAAFRLVAGPSAGDALIPALDQTRTVGLVTLPGAFVGMVLGGASPAAAAALQLVVLIALLAAGSLAILTITELLCRASLPDGRSVRP